MLGSISIIIFEWLKQKSKGKSMRGNVLIKSNIEADLRKKTWLFLKEPVMLRK